MSEIFVFGGCNGSGKSTFATSFLYKLNPRPEFINADLIAAQLNPNDVDSVAISAGRIMLERLNYLSELQLDFAFETTLAARSFVPFLKRCQNNGYQINLFYIWLNSPQLAIFRVSRRVEAGGHNIPQNTIHRRYQRGLFNFFELYSTLAARWIVYDNSQQLQKIAEKPLGQTQIIYNPVIWQQIISLKNR
jgi:predicted ABC-type ATPase